MSDEEKKRKHEQEHEGEEPCEQPKRDEPSQPLTDSSQDPPPQVPPGG